MYKLLKRYKSEGLRWTFIRKLARLIGQPLDIQRSKDKIWDILLNKYSYKVAYGPLKGMLLNKDTWWSKNDRITQTLGVYEQHVMEKLIELSGINNSQFVDIGAADGYFAVGMAYSNFYDNIYAFEISKRGQDKIKENAIRNSCLDSVIIKGEANYDSLNNIINNDAGTVLLIDIEGFEFELLTTDILILLRNCHVICELHPWLVNDGYDKQDDFIESAKKYFDVSLIKRDYYNPSAFEELDNFSDEERLIALGEGRKKNMNWLVLEPKK